MNNQNISQAELVVMKELWKESPLSAHQIDGLVKSQNWTTATVKSLINRLLKKGFIKFEQQGRAYFYLPVVAKADYLVTQNQTFIGDLYDGKLSNMVAAFTSHEKLSAEEIAEIKAMIEKMEQQP
ncbi:BlaI/MecI/CopY family transcriptional regulator [Marinicella rhabdoformis]|uniref:BlaI/MecI/CopY family transcriptional regulator n=1 Tax=Marinicella rhabdoformis TaxID=2580566 RepID=UPI0012AEC7C4|nr:BlaI/MecI/CopY family transcriptional regulator [Marinicella rhabdoformis]